MRLLLSECGESLFKVFFVTTFYHVNAECGFAFFSTTPFWPFRSARFDCHCFTGKRVFDAAPNRLGQRQSPGWESFWQVILAAQKKSWIDCTVGTPPSEPTQKWLRSA